MSFSITFDCFKNGELSRFPRSIVEDIFGPFANDPKSNYWDLLFPDKGYGYLHINPDKEITGFSINRPTGNLLLAKVFEALLKTECVLGWEPGTAVADASVIANLPSWWIDARGTPYVVHSGEEITRCIERS